MCGEKKNHIAGQKKDLPILIVKFSSWNFCVCIKEINEALLHSTVKSYIIRKGILKSECPSKKSTIVAQSLWVRTLLYQSQGNRYKSVLTHKDLAKIVDFLLGHSDFRIAFLRKL